MARTGGAVDARFGRALIVLIGGTGGLLLISLLSTTPGSPSAVLLTAVALSLAAVVGLSRLPLAPAYVVSGRTLRRAHDVPAFLAGRVTDTARHPVRPRAPGLV